ncbi:thioredoxin-disulfide reductase [Treponema primitia ZAS-2]|uniref:Thioredoxin reductase n=1 Tax=Treponema primitia (strain ATCC BAA-887 / DSM 12427 / ZAS-2) TaxID=545694 RepID=F5YP36_TREPZ|nr:thioredoxin-disulfide reductase [Treponema primitia]AEF84115.1 thioredoxin-disulfide reductase [Treponema primitia ZAS-2]
MAQLEADLLILGAGPAGLSAAQYGSRANLKVLAIEQLSPGGQALSIDKLENYPGDPTPRSGFDFAEDMHRQAENFGAKILSDAVLSLKNEKNSFTAVLGSGGEIKARAVILATGATHRTLGIPGEAEFNGRGVSYCASCDGPFFKGKRILVVGGGDAACDEARFLAFLSDRVLLVHRRDKFRAQKSLAERVLHDPRIEVRLNTSPVKILGDKQVNAVILENTADHTQYEEPVNAVFIFVGTTPQTSLVPDAEKDEAGYIVTDQRMASSIPGIFVAGDVRASPFRQVVVAAAEGAIAAHCAAEYIENFC